jgi:hypothetical protein
LRRGTPLGLSRGVHVLSIERPGRPAERLELATPLQAGGSRADDLQLATWPPSALRLVPADTGVVVEANAFGVRVAGRPVPPGGRRLLRPGERAELHGVAIGVEAAPVPDATRAAAAALLRGAARGDALALGPHLLVLTGPAAGARHPLCAEQTVGRGRAASIVLPDPHASRVHARLRLGDEGAWVEDLGSKNGVRVNGVRIERRPCELRPGDELLVGETALALQDAGGTLAPAAPPASPCDPPRRRVPARLVAAALLAASAAALALAAT